MADRRALFAVARLLHGRHGSAFGLRPVSAQYAPEQAAFRALHHARPRQAGKDDVLPRLDGTPAPFRRPVRHRPRRARHGHAGLHAAVLPLRLQDHQGRLRRDQGSGPRDGQGKIPARQTG